MSDIEAPTRAKIRAHLDSDFHVHEGWTGHHKHSGEQVRYDLAVRPRTHLIEKGFDDGVVIIEVKLFNSDDKKKHDVKVRDLLWQCVAYSFSEVQLPDGTHECPLFSLYYIGGTGVDEFYQPELKTLHHFVQRGGVGRLEFAADGAWSMRFGGSPYFRSKYGKGPHHVGTKRQTGSAR